MTSARRSRSSSLLDEDAQHADRGAAQAERILGAARLLADGEDAGQRVELVGQRDRDTGAGARQCAAGAARQIVLVDRLGDLGGLAVGRGVVAPHDSLQLGELADHRGQQVALGELAARSAFARSASMSNAISPASVSTRRTLSPIEPSLAWNVTASSAGRRAASGCLRSWLQKNAASDSRGRTTRSLPARTLSGSRLSMLATVMKCGSSLPSAPCTGKVALVLLQRGDQHFARQLEEARLEGTGDGAGPFDQRGDFVEQRLARAAPRRQGFRRGGDLRRGCAARRAPKSAITLPFSRRTVS